MVYNTQYKTLVKNEQAHASTSMTSKKAFRDWNDKKKELARQADKYGGRRLLGVTDKNVPIWASFTIDKETLQIKVKLSHDMDTIRKSKLCPRRVTLATNETLLSLDNEMRPAPKKSHGEVTLNTLNYLEKVMSIVDSPTIGKEKGKCTTSLFMIVSNLIYEGSTEGDKFRWHDVMDTWNMPKGKYLTVYG